jgi:hypothetical protein
MDQRTSLLDILIELHSKLLDVFHASTSDNQLLMEFCNAFITLVKAVKPKISSNRFDYIFKPLLNLTNGPELNSHLLAAADYAAIIVKRIEADPALEMGNEVIAVIFDYAKLLQAFAKKYGLSFGQFAGSRNMKVDAYTSYKIATQFFWSPHEIQRSNTLNGYTIFALRQGLEFAAKEVLGLAAITNKAGAPDFYASKIPWQFIVDHQDKPYFNLPFKPSEMQKIYQWSNHFVHSGNDALCYVTALALTTVDQLFQNQQVNYWEGRTDWVSANEIKHYQLLKKDFEDYLASLKTPKFAKWAPTAKLAYVTG